MKAFPLLAAFCLLTTRIAAADSFPEKKIDDAVAKARERKEIPGAVVVVVHQGEVVFRKAYGERAIQPQPEAMTVDTIFDLASLTKPIATASSIHHLLESKKIQLSDRISQFWPEFGTHGKDQITIAHCLLHTSGLTADNAIGDYAQGEAEAIANIARLKLEAKPGERFRYSDVGFIVLGEIIRRRSGLSVDQYSRQHIFEPLNMKETLFKPNPQQARIAPTGRRNGQSIRGQVHDPRSFAMGGIAGHAGLFSTADDLAIFAKAILSNQTTSPLYSFGQSSISNIQSVGSSGHRTYGWDVDTSFSSPRGDWFVPGEGYGHTGFTGTSIWIDRQTSTAIIILSNRVHPDDKGNATELRRSIASITGEYIFRNEKLNGEWNRSRGATIPTNVLPGIDVLKAEQFAILKGKSIGLVTNHTGQDRDGNSTIDLLAKANGVKLVKLFSPEHGIRGEKDEKVGDGKDDKTGLPIYSLYGERRKPTVEQLQGLDALVYDLQDIGCRFYTYISTLKGVMEVATAAKVPVIVLDRPNPLGGLLVEGSIRDPNRESFVGCHALPVRHGMTVGELATLFQADSFPDCQLSVVRCRNWRRDQFFDLTALPWRNPSPNMRHLTAAMLYPGVGLLETTNISVGRGTERPFEWIGAPWIDGKKLAIELNAARIPGVSFIAVDRTPISSVHKDKLCHGVDLIVTNRNQLDAVKLGLTIAKSLKKVHAKEWEPKRFDTLLIHKRTFTDITTGSNSEPTESETEAMRKFEASRRKALLYP